MIVCITNISEIDGKIKPLTIGRHYKVIEFSKFWGYSIINDNGYLESYQPFYFQKIDDYRNDRLNNLGI